MPTEILLPGACFSGRALLRLNGKRLDIHTALEFRNNKCCTGDRKANFDISNFAIKLRLDNFREIRHNCN